MKQLVWALKEVFVIHMAGKNSHKSRSVLMWTVWCLFSIQYHIMNSIELGSRKNKIERAALGFKDVIAGVVKVQVYQH